MARYPTDIRIVVPGHIPFGQPDKNAKHGFHAGDDSANAGGTPVYAPVSSKVYSTADSGNQGIAVQMFDGTYYPHVFHLSRRVVNTGDAVQEGQLIGYVGSTGISSGSHVHFGVSKVPYQNTKSISDYIDPLEYIKRGEPMLNDEIIKYLYGAYTGREPNQGELDSWRGRPTNTLVTTLVTSKEANQRYAEVQAALKGSGNFKQVGTVDGEPIYKKVG